MEELVFEKSVCVCVHMCLTVLLHACEFTRVGEGERAKEMEGNFWGGRIFLYLEGS